MGIAGGWRHSLAVRSDGSVIAWGNNSWGQCDVPDLPVGITYVQVAAGERFSAARRSDGSIIAWGEGGLGKLDVPALPSGLVYVDLDLGREHAVARRSDGAVVAWGQNWFGQCDVPSLPAGLTYVEVSAGSAHTVALRSDGAVVAWGYKAIGLCDVPALRQGQSYYSVQAGVAHNVARYGASPPAATMYCTAKANSLGCTPSISIVGLPSASFGNGSTVSTARVIGQQIGLYFHSTSGAQALPFHGGYVCVAPPLRRHGLLQSGGTNAQCDGVLVEDFNAYIASGADPALVAGATVWIQAWSRDPGDPFGDSLSDALSATISP